MEAPIRDSEGRDNLKEAILRWVAQNERLEREWDALSVLFEEILSMASMRDLMYKNLVIDGKVYVITDDEVCQEETQEI